MNKVATINYENQEIDVFYVNGQLLANIKEDTDSWIMDYDYGSTFEENLEALCDVVTENWTA